MTAELFVIQYKNQMANLDSYINSDGLPDLDVSTNVFMIQSPQAPKVVPVNPNKGHINEYYDLS